MKYCIRYGRTFTSMLVAGSLTILIGATAFATSGVENYVAVLQKAILRPVLNSEADYIRDLKSVRDQIFVAQTKCAAKSAERINCLFSLHLALTHLAEIQNGMDCKNIMLAKLSGELETNTRVRVIREALANPKRPLTAKEKEDIAELLKIEDSLKVTKDLSDQLDAVLRSVGFHYGMYGHVDRPSGVERALEGDAYTSRQATTVTAAMARAAEAVRPVLDALIAKPKIRSLLRTSSLP